MQNRDSVAVSYQNDNSDETSSPPLQDASNAASPLSETRQIEQQLADFEKSERSKMALNRKSVTHWSDANPSHFVRSQRDSTTILIAGFTLAHDKLIQSVFRRMGYNMLAIDQPDNESLRYGKEYGNRGQCNPTYFTVGNLIKYLSRLRDSGLSTQYIIDHYIFGTVGSCGPCRFGTYVTEYRKALRDAGFAGFRVVQFEQSKGINQITTEAPGVEFGVPFFWYMSRALVMGDILNILGYRIRPYELLPGSTNSALAECRQILCNAFENRQNIILALLKVRRTLAAVRVDRLRVKPKVSVIGEFWAMTTEGDGNYRLHSYLEQEGAEVEVQTITSWLLYLLWQARYDVEQRAILKGADERGPTGSRFGLAGVDVRKKLLLIKSGEAIMKTLFFTIGKLMGLKGYKIPSMDYIAAISHDYFDNNVRGGEGHMEVGKVIANNKYKKVNMTISVKPFGCMPSSGVSDGVQSLISELYPEGIFLALETNGDGATNFYSRIQMQLFKAKQQAEREAEVILSKHSVSLAALKNQLMDNNRMQSALHFSPTQSVTTSAAATMVELLRSQSSTFLKRLSRYITQFS